ncbi:hypothetical protein [Caulobacter soli]|uniref:hypothetical protein n=1 Tax=Caulobacter soli TaxID=2708539 RepID=UPI0013E9B5AF|nr:hypothetical protein [Caulobacter soli]
MSEEGKTIADYAEREKENSAAWRKVWIASLGVANGAGLLAAANALKDARGELWFALLPTMWMMALGVAAAGAIPWARLRYHMCVARRFEAAIGQDREGLGSSKRSMVLWDAISISLNLAGAAGFLIGMCWALFAITFRVATWPWVATQFQP